jgi:imidazolonepropionase
MKVLGNIGQLATCRGDGVQGDIHLIAGAAVAWDEAGIRWVGPERDLPDQYRNGERLDAGARLVIPGLIDCHTHLAFGGWRADEFAERIRGRSYLEIAKTGGGIAATVRQTRAATEASLTERAARVLEEVLALGVTTLECKSGYGLNEETELKLLRVYRRLSGEQPVRLVSTFLGAHVVPSEFQHDREGYISLLIDRLLPRIAEEQLASFCDVFVEESAFSLDEARRILRAGKAAGLRPKLHADQLSNCAGAELAAEEGAVSADHLESISERGIAALAKAGVVAVSLPLAALYLRQQPMPARRLIDHGVAIAVATDFNPGTAPSYHLPLALTLACTLQRMTPAEALKGATVYAARAVGLEAEIGSVEVGKTPDLAVIDAPDVDHWLYYFRPNACLMTIVGGVPRWARDAAHQSA